ncbi:MAG TPA: 3-hydroxyacyl-CoA dehydrogenase NAD-binding domain-containing protein, partial [Acidobacteriota bacterium]|nr:3-hydroxyacyl-CoA dehydrogenase NAD-binding domain-containing protein [Acidobacteriota bacterium]
MNRKLEKAAVLGAGVMGAQIAAHLANAGVSVTLLDIVPPSLSPA